MSFIQAAVHGRVEKERASHNPRQEFLDYINSPLETCQYDPVKWWGGMLLKDSLDFISDTLLFIAPPGPISDPSPDCS